MSQKASSKIHTAINHPRSLCGLAPKNGEYNIASNSAFFAAPDADQCATCIKKLKILGYKVEELRTKYRALHQHAERISTLGDALLNGDCHA